MRAFFEELTPEQFERQLTTNLIGPTNVTRAVLPVMRKQRSGHGVTITSTGGIVGQEFCSVYSASKFGLEGTAQTRPACEAMSGKQGGDPAKLAKALLSIVDQEQPPLRWVAGADAVATVEQKANELLSQVNAYRDLSSSLAID